jgi:hypothetical protein
VGGVPDPPQRRDKRVRHSQATNQICQDGLSAPITEKVAEGSAQKECWKKGHVSDPLWNQDLPLSPDQ